MGAAAVAAVEAVAAEEVVEGAAVAAVAAEAVVEEEGAVAAVVEAEEVAAGRSTHGSQPVEAVAVAGEVVEDAAEEAVGAEEVEAAGEEAMPSLAVVAEVDMLPLEAVEEAMLHPGVVEGASRGTSSSDQWTAVAEEAVMLLQPLTMHHRPPTSLDRCHSRATRDPRQHPATRQHQRPAIRDQRLLLVTALGLLLPLLPLQRQCRRTRVRFWNFKIRISNPTPLTHPIHCSPSK